MRSLWTKIGLGAVGIFLIGMMLLTAVRQANSAVRSAIASAIPAHVSSVARAAALTELPFTLEGARLGTVENISVVRAAPGEVPHLDLSVLLAAPAAASRLAGCDLVPYEDPNLDFERGFRCARANEGPWVAIGSVHFDRGGFTRPVQVSPSLARELQKGDPFEATAELGGEVHVSARGDAGELVRILAHRHGADIKISDAMGRALLRLLADSTGASLRVRDEGGREVVRLEAGQGRLSLTVDTAGVGE